MATYVLVLEILEDIIVPVGSLGDVYLHEGLYLYIGSAKRGLRRRITRHFSGQKKCYWHIDYILSSNSCCLLEAWTTPANRECDTASAVSQFPEARAVRKGIGSSDCRCWTHFFLFDAQASHLHLRLRQNGFDSP